MQQLDRYLFREFAQATFAALVVLLMVSLGGVFADVLGDIARGRVPLRSVFRSSVRWYRLAPITLVASSSISSCNATRTASWIRFTPSPVRNASSSSDRADWDKAIGVDPLW